MTSVGLAEADIARLESEEGLQRRQQTTSERGAAAEAEAARIGRQCSSSDRHARDRTGDGITDVSVSPMRCLLERGRWKREREREGELQ